MAGLLSDVLPYVYSQGNRAKRYLGGLLSDPIGEAQQTAGKAMDDLRALSELEKQAFADRKNPVKVTNRQAFNNLSEKYMNGVMNFAPAGIFIGEKAKNWNASAAKQFLELEKRGLSNKEAFQQTGTFRSPDGKLRQEIDDSKSYTDFAGASEDYAKPLKEGSVFNVSDVYSNKNLEAAYPEIQGYTVGFMPKDRMDGAFGAFSEKHRRFTVPEGVADKGQASDLAHEMQHAIQRVEGFSPGGNMQSIRRDVMNYADPKVIEYAKTLPAYQRAEDKDDFIKSFVQMRMGDPYQAYRKLMGEAEARAVEKRFDYSPEKRAKVFPLESYDIPIDQLIFKRGLLD